MSAYPFICRPCDTARQIHARIGSDVPRPACPSCGEPMARDYSSVAIAPSALATRTGAAHVIESNDREAGWSKDHAAYKRLRRQGYQPPTTQGCAELEMRANTRTELEHGMNHPLAVAERMGIVQEPV